MGLKTGLYSFLKHEQKHIGIVMLIFLYIIPYTLFAQNSKKIEWFTDSEGLPQNSVKSIIKDRYNFIWLATEDGLARYDGKNFSVYSTSDIPKLQSARMIFFAGSPEKDSVFIRSGSGDILLIRNRDVHYVEKKDTPPLLSLVDSISEVEKLNEYQVMLSGHALFLDDVSMDFKQHLKTPNKRYSISNTQVEEKQFSGAKYFTYTYKESRERQFFMLDEALYHLTKNGVLYEYAEGKQNLIEANLPENASIYTNYVANQVFLFKDKNMYLIKEIKNNHIQKELIFEDLDINYSDISSAFYDKENDKLYLGTYAKGLAVVNNLPISTILDPGRSADNIIYALTKINDSTLMTGTGKVIQQGKIIASNNLEQISDKYNLINFENEGIWTSDINQLFYLKNKGDYTYKVDKSWILSDSVRILMVQKKDADHIWISVMKWNLSQHNTLYYKSTNPDDSEFHKVAEVDFRINSLLQIDKDSILLGSKSDGLYLMTRFNKAQPSIKKIDSEKRITGFFQRDNEIWVTTYGQGFYMLKDGRLIPGSQDKAGFLSTPHCMIEDEDQNIWIPTNRGMFKIPFSNLEANLNGKTQRLFYNYFDKSYGLMTNEFNGGCFPCGVQLNDHRIYFPSMNGVVSFKPEELSKTGDPIGLYFDEIKIDGKYFPVAEHIKLEKAFQRIDFRVAIPFYGARNNIHLEAALDDGSNSQSWMSFNPDEAISFTNLSPGSYTLKIRAQFESEDDYYYNQMTMNIPPLFWQTLWFKVLFVILMCLLLLLGFYLRIQHITREKQRLTKEVALRTKDLTETIEQLGKTELELKRQLSFQNSITRSISHDLKTPIKYLNIYCRQIYTNPDEVENKEAIRLIYNTGDRIGKFVENLLIYSKANVQAINKDKENVYLHELANDCITFFEIPLLTQGSRFKNNIPTDLIIQTNVQVLKIIIQNILDNAIKNTQEGVIEVDALSHSEEILIRIEDNGGGIGSTNLRKFNLFFKETEIEDEETRNTPIGLGYRIIKHLLPYVRGRITIESEEGKGTAFNVYLGNDPLG